MISHESIVIIKTIPGRIPSDITVRRWKEAVAAAIRNAFFQAVTNVVLTLACRCDYRSTTSGNRKIGRINQTFEYGDGQKLMTVNLKEGCVRLVIDGKEVFSIDLSNCSTVTFSMDRALEPFCAGCFTFFFLRGRIWGERLSESESKSFLKKA